MVVTKEQLISEEAREQSGLLVERVEQDMADVLNEHGSAAPEGHRKARVYSFGYGIPMVGVRYYSFTEEEK